MFPIKEIPQDDVQNLAKRAAAYQACQSLKSGMCIGLGTGSTAYYAIEFCALEVAKGLQITAVPSSEETKRLCELGKIPLISPDEVQVLDVVIDGADAMDLNFHVTKGGGAALFREKVLAHMGREVIWIMDESKLVHALGAFPIPVEISPFAAYSTFSRLEELKYLPSFRLKSPLEKKYRSVQENMEYLKSKEQLLLTDNGNYLLDLYLGEGFNPQDMAKTLAQIPGIIEHGLFLNYCSKAIIAFKDGHIEERINPHFVNKFGKEKK